MASLIWRKLPRYADIAPPRFSVGWLNGFKDRHSIKKYFRHEKVGAVDTVAVEEELIDLRNNLSEYDNEDIYNMNDSALY